jgi:hypothetical protein
VPGYLDSFEHGYVGSLPAKGEYVQRVSITSYGEDPTQKVGIWPEWVGEQRRPEEYSAAHKDKLAKRNEMSPQEREQYNRKQRP